MRKFMIKSTAFSSEDAVVYFLHMIFACVTFATQSWAAIGLSVLLSSCAEAPLNRGGFLSSYDNMTSSDGVLTKSLIKVNRGDVLAAKTVRITPTIFSETAMRVSFSDEQRRLIENTVDRTLCVGLSDRFRVVQSSEPADLTVRAIVTSVTPTDELAAGASKVISIVPMALSLSYPVPVPRIPIGSEAYQLRRRRVAR